MNNNTCNYFRNFEGEPTLIRLVSGIDAPAGSSGKTIVQQRLTVINNGAVSLISTTKNRDVAESLNFDIDAASAASVISKIARFFSKPVDNKRYPAVGNYDLTITNSEGISYFYDGSLKNNYTIDGDLISDYVRKALNLPQLFVFEDSGMKKEIRNLEISSYENGENIAINYEDGTLNYSNNNCSLKVNAEEKIRSLLEKYGEKFDQNFSFASKIGNIWSYKVKVNYSYGDDLEFGGSDSDGNHPYFWNELLSDIRKIVNDNLAGSLFGKENHTVKKPVYPGCYNLALVSGNDLPRSTWYRYTDEDLESGDFVLVPDNYGNYVIGKVLQTKTEYNNSGNIMSTYRNILKKL